MVNVENVVVRKLPTYPGTSTVHVYMTYIHVHVHADSIRVSVQVEHIEDAECTQVPHVPGAHSCS